MFGQVIIGLANSGKSTFSKTVSAYLKDNGRNIKMINLDPAAEDLPYTADIDIRDLVCIDEIMEQECLGPNGSIMFAMEYLLTNISWLEEKLSSLDKNSYLMIDLPGQVELYTHSPIIPQLMSRLTDPKGLSHRLTAVFLAESIYCQDPAAYLAILIDTLSSMLQLAMPQVNLLSKFDMMKSTKKKLVLPAKEFERAEYINHLVNFIPGGSGGKRARFYHDLVDVIIDLPWHGFTFFDCKKKKSIEKVVSQIDMANGYFEKRKSQPTVSDVNNDVENDAEFNQAADELVERLF